jgi:hypothetical protein
MNLPVFRLTFLLITAVFSIFTIWYHFASYEWESMPILGILLGMAIGVIFGFILASFSAIYTNVFQYTPFKLGLYFALMVVFVIILTIVMLQIEANLPTIQSGWEEIPAPPEPAIALNTEYPCSDAGGVLWISSESGMLYSYVVGEGYVYEWQRFNRNELSTAENYDECLINPDYQKRALRLPPLDEKDSIAIIFEGADGFMQTNYILTENGQIYEWNGGGHMGGVILFFGWIFFGIISSFFSVVMLAEKNGVWRT